MTANEDDPADLSLEQVEHHVWGDAPADATHLMATVHRLRRKLIKHLTAADLRTLIAQRVGLAVLVPRMLPGAPAHRVLVSRRLWTRLGVSTATARVAGDTTQPDRQRAR